MINLHLEAKKLYQVRFACPIDRIITRAILPQDVGKKTWDWETITNAPSRITGQEDIIVIVNTIIAHSLIKVIVEYQGAKIAILTTGYTLQAPLLIRPGDEFYFEVTPTTIREQLRASQQFAFGGIVAEKKGRTITY